MNPHKIIHAKHSTIPDASNTEIVRASDWNAEHSIQWGFATPNKTTITSADGNIQGDPYYNYVELLISADGVNGSTSFIDYGTHGITLTANNGAIQTNYISKWGTTCAMFDGTDDYVSGTLYSPIGTNDFCMEAWVFLDAYTTYCALCDLRIYSGGYTGFIWLTSPSGYLGFQQNGATQLSSTHPIPLGTWAHICVERVSGVINLYVEGERVLTQAHTNDINNTSFRIGNQTLTASSGSFYMNDFRLSTGIARYNPGSPYIFSPPTSKAATQMPGLSFDSGMNFTSVGPITISDVDVNIPNGTTWVIL